MKKRFFAILAVIALCLASLAGCSVVKSAERDVQVALKVGNEYQGTYTVNIFNNAIVEEPTAPAGTLFLGWTPQADWESLGAENVHLTQNKGLIRYDDIKDWLKDNDLSITLYAVFGEIARHDLVIAWYNKPATSGLDESIIEQFTANLNTYLTSQGYTPADMDIIIRGYSGNVGPTCDAIKSDADVDIMIGWATASNLSGTGGLTPGVDFLENYGNIKINPDKARYSARLSDTELTRLVYSWILTEYSDGATEDYTSTPSTPETPENPENPETPTEPERTPITLPDVGEAATSDKVTIAWYSKTATSGIEQTHMDELKTALEVYLTEQGKTGITVTVRGYDGDVATTCGNIKTDGDVDVMIGWAASSNLSDKAGWVEGTDFLVNYGEVTVGSKARYSTWLTNTDVSKLTYIWVLTTYGNYSYSETPIEPETPVVPENPETPTEPERTPITLPDVGEAATSDKVTIAWYSKTATSGIEQTHMDELKTALEVYLTEQGKTGITVTVRGYDGDVATTCGNIKTDGDVDVMIGWAASSNLSDKAGWVEGTDFLVNYGEVTVGSKARYSAWLTNTDVSKLTYIWVLTTYGNYSYSETPTEPETPVEPTEPEPQPITETSIVIGWYSKSGTSGLDTSIMLNFKKALISYLSSETRITTQPEIEIRAYNGVVADVQSAVTADGDVDLMIGMKAFTLEGITMEVQENVVMGAKTDRRIHLISQSGLASAVFEWLKTNEARDCLKTAETAVESKLVIGWYNKSGTSGLDQTIIDTFTTGLNAYLTAQGFTVDNIEIVIRAYEGNVADVQSAVTTDGDVDIMLGMKAFTLDGVTMEVQQNVVMGAKTDRRIHLVSGSGLANFVFEWLKTDSARSLFATVA